MLRDVMPGDLVAVRIEGALRWFLVGALLGAHKRKSTKVEPEDVRMVIAHELEAESLLEPRGALYPSIVSADVEVVAVVATASRLREMRTRWFHTSSRPGIGTAYRDGGDEVDPMQRAQGGRNPWR